MKRTLTGLAAIALLLTVLGTPLSVSAAPPEIHVFHSGYTMLDATFTTTDPSGCVTTVAEVSAILGRAQSPGEGPEYALPVTASVEQWTLCPEYALQIDASSWATYTGATLVAPPDLTQASLQATVAINEAVTGRMFNLVIDLVWTCPGPAAPSPYTFHQHESNFMINLHGQITLNEGCQADGIVSDGTTDFATAPTTNTFVAAGKSGEVDIFR